MIRHTSKANATDTKQNSSRTSQRQIKQRNETTGQRGADNGDRLSAQIAALDVEKQPHLLALLAQVFAGLVRMGLEALHLDTAPHSTGLRSGARHNPTGREHGAPAPVERSEAMRGSPHGGRARCSVEKAEPAAVWNDMMRCEI